MTPKEARQRLTEGNTRFQTGKTIPRDHQQRVKQTAAEQAPFATILGCIDSRTAPEIIFDQGIGDLLSVRIAGNVINNDIIGSLEFGAEALGSKLICILGHTGCGAVTAACQGAGAGHIEGVLKNINHSIGENEGVDAVASRNVSRQIAQLREKSSVLRKLEQQGKIEICGGMYDVQTGQVSFM